MTAPPSPPVLPSWLQERVRTPQQALEQTVTNGTRLGSGLATSEPTTFYAGLWDHVKRRDVRGLDIRQGLFLEPHQILVGDALDVARRNLPGPLAMVSGAVADARSLRRLATHLEELQQRQIVFTSAFLGPVANRMVPDTPITRLLAPRLAGRNRVTAGYTRYQPVHFPDAASALATDDSGQLTIDLFVQPMTWPDTRQQLSFGMSNGVNGSVVPMLLDSQRGHLLLYLNARLPFTTGPGNTLALERLRPLADQGRLTVVVEDTVVPGVPPGSFDDPLPVETAIADHVLADITGRLEDTAGRALQIGIGRVSALIVERLKGSAWTGRGYTEMLDPGTYDLLEDGTIQGTHIQRSDGTRQLQDGIVCTFAMGERGSDFATRLDHDERVIMMPATDVLQPQAFTGGLGINNVLAIDLAGNVNATSRDHHPHSAVGGLATIMRGLADGGVAYLCMKSTHRTPSGTTRSSIMPGLPSGTAVTLTAPDLLGTRNGARIMLATEHGVAPLHARPLDEMMRSLVSVAAPEHRDELRQAAWIRYRVRL